MGDKTSIEVAYATPAKQEILECKIDPDTSLRAAVRLSGIGNLFPEINFETCDLGVFGKVVPDDYELQDGDRIEIYRPLIADPKEIRRQRAAQGLKMKKGGGKISQD
ncbi:MAG: RnfH family protein [Gammaproteobacteria bacterium]|nr:RnfH family protein [Gammaproteobacteria bacterium]MDH3448596.1 RnfH family protein [Gammaproteobacteria bacterium]